MTAQDQCGSDVRFEVVGELSKDAIETLARLLLETVDRAEPKVGNVPTGDHFASTDSDDSADRSAEGATIVP